jgi:hypothetical protein
LPNVVILSAPRKTRPFFLTAINIVILKTPREPETASRILSYQGILVMQFMQTQWKIRIACVAAMLSCATPAFAQYNGQPQYPNQQTMPQQQPMYAMPPQGGYAPQGMAAVMPQGGGVSPQGMQAPAQNLTIGQWFTRYDQIRHDAQMSPMERQQADNLMSKGLSILVPGDTKVATKQLLSTLVGRYQRACFQLKELPVIAPTQQLHTSYWNYFNTAGGLFSDYLRVQDNLFMTDPSGSPLAATLMQRKQSLEALEARCKQIDASARAQFGIPAYPF